MPPRFGGRTETKTHSTSLHAAEVVLFRALLEKEFRRQAWVFARNPDLMSTPAGERLARAVGAAFPVGEPVGEPTLWLSRVGTSEDQDLLASLALDLRGGEVTVEVLTDSVAKLRNLAATRQRTRKQEVAKTEDEKQAILLAMRRQNPNWKEKAKDVEDRFD
jgi:tRNA(Met) C34 N-acetyltransferase TmcA